MRTHLEQLARASCAASSDVADVPLLAWQTPGQIAQLPAPGFAAYLPVNTRDLSALGGRTFAHSACSIFVTLFARTLGNHAASE